MCRPGAGGRRADLHRPTAKMRSDAGASFPGGAPADQTRSFTGSKTICWTPTLCRALIDHVPALGGRYCGWGRAAIKEESSKVISRAMEPRAVSALGLLWISSGDEGGEGGIWGRGRDGASWAWVIGWEDKTGTGTRSDLQETVSLPLPRLGLLPGPSDQPVMLSPALAPPRGAGLTQARAWPPSATPPRWHWASSTP